MRRSSSASWPSWAAILAPTTPALAAAAAAPAAADAPRVMIAPAALTASETAAHSISSRIRSRTICSARADRDRRLVEEVGDIAGAGRELLQVRTTSSTASSKDCCAAPLPLPVDPVDRDPLVHGHLRHGLRHRPPPQRGLVHLLVVAGHPLPLLQQRRQQRAHAWRRSPRRGRPSWASRSTGRRRPRRSRPAAQERPRSARPPRRRPSRKRLRTSRTPSLRSSQRWATSQIPARVARLTARNVAISSRAGRILPSASGSSTASRRACWILIRVLRACRWSAATRVIAPNSARSRLVMGPPLRWRLRGGRVPASDRRGNEPFVGCGEPRQRQRSRALGTRPVAGLADLHLAAVAPAVLSGRKSPLQNVPGSNHCARRSRASTPMSCRVVATTSAQKASSGRTLRPRLLAGRHRRRGRGPSARAACAVLGNDTPSRRAIAVSSASSCARPDLGRELPQPGLLAVGARPAVDGLAQVVQLYAAVVAARPDVGQHLGQLGVPHQRRQVVDDDGHPDMVDRRVGQRPDRAIRRRTPAEEPQVAGPGEVDRLVQGQARHRPWRSVCP